MTVEVWVILTFLICNWHQIETVQRFSALEVHHSALFGNLNFHTHGTKCRLWTFLPDWVIRRDTVLLLCVWWFGVFFLFCLGVWGFLWLFWCGLVCLFFFFLFHPPLSPTPTLLSCLPCPTPPPASEYLVHWEDRYYCNAVPLKLVLQNWSFEYVMGVLSVLHAMKYLHGTGSRKC